MVDVSDLPVQGRKKPRSDCPEHINIVLNVQDVSHWTVFPLDSLDPKWLLQLNNNIHVFPKAHSVLNNDVIAYNKFSYLQTLSYFTRKCSK